MSGQSSYHNINFASAITGNMLESVLWSVEYIIVLYDWPLVPLRC